MELAENGSLQDFLVNRTEPIGTLHLSTTPKPQYSDWDLRLKLEEQICDVMMYLHSQRLFHSYSLILFSYLLLLTAMKPQGI
jgi:hypothetical protein